MRKVSAWLRSHPWTVFFGSIVLFFAAAHFASNWLAERRWQKYAAEARARGAKLTLADLSTPEIPDAENFAALPMFRAIFQGGVQRPMELPRTGGNPPGFGNPMKGERIDWAAWQKFFLDAGWISETTSEPARDVLLGLEHYAPQFQEWSEWPNRPRCRFPLELEKGFAMPLPHLSTFNDAAKLFALRAQAHLALGNSAAAGGDFRSGLQAYRALVDEPTLISGLVRIAALAVTLRAVGDGLRDRSWAETELKQIDAELAALEIWKDFRLAFGSERGFGNWMYDLMAAATPWRRAGLLSQMSAAGGTGSPDVLMALIPRRLIRDNQLRANYYFDELEARVGADGRRYDPDRPTPSDLEHMTGILEPYYFFLCRLSLPIFSSVIDRYVHLQTLINETRVAIALERYHLARGNYPETLAELVPAFLEAVPLDTYSREPLIYRREATGAFLLYGVGKNRADDGGAVDPKLSEIKQPDERWPYAPPP